MKKYTLHLHIIGEHQTHSFDDYENCEKEAISYAKHFSRHQRLIYITDEKGAYISAESDVNGVFVTLPQSVTDIICACQCELREELTPLDYEPKLAPNRPFDDY